MLLLYGKSRVHPALHVPSAVLVLLIPNAVLVIDSERESSNYCLHRAAKLARGMK